MPQFFYDKKTPQRLDIVLASQPQIDSRQEAKKIIQQGLVSVQGEKNLSPRYLVKEGEGVFFEKQNWLKKTLQPSATPLEIHYEDEQLLVLYKPAGLIVHPASSHQQISLVEQLLAYTSLPNFKDCLRPGIVHRIDKDTSGLLVVAKTEFCQQALQKQFQAHNVHRKYLCFVCGIQDKNFGTVEKNIVRNKKTRKTFQVSQTEGKKAITHWKVLEKWNSVGFLECKLETGRTHQIRVHLSSIGLPIVGDKMYGKVSKKHLSHFSPQQQKKILEFPRQALHASEIGFTHPNNQKKIFCQRHLPKDMQDLLVLIEQTKNQP